VGRLQGVRRQPRQRGQHRAALRDRWLPVRAVRRTPYGAVRGLIGLLSENWSFISGEFTLTTGKDLRDQQLYVLYDVAYAFIRRSALRTKEEQEALDKVDRMIMAMHEDFEVGLPGFVRQFKPADELYG
jgi:hypothetical protein